YIYDAFYKYIRTVFTINNINFQGRCYLDAINYVTLLPQEYFNMNTLESYGQANLLKGGVVFADYVTTVSETYAKEILSIDGGEGLDGLFRMRSFRTQGILNGLNYMDQDPSADTRIACRFDGNIAAYKKANKAALQTELGLEQREDAFLIGMVSRLTDQKGFDLVDYILDEIMGMERVQIVVLGTGEQRYEDQFRFYQGKYPGRLSANIFYSEDMAQRIYASCDAFLMPSLFEPCGLSQLMAMRYGTVPLVRETGGLKDTVEPYNEFEHTGTGFTFHNYNAHEMLYMIRYAEKIFTQYPDEWMDMIRRDMETDYSWESSCRKYMVLYEALLTETKEQKAEEIKKQKEAEEAEKRRREEELRIKILMEKEAAGAAKKTKEAEAAKTKKKAAAAKQTGKKKAADSAKASSEKSASAKTAVGDASAKTAVKKTSARITVKK
ncbi:MAG: glycogen/starch synthase, partial [Clostridiales bacterium]|nr:glycogen/starch synthase [Clostridiales bacterium]